MPPTQPVPASCRARDGGAQDSAAKIRAPLLAPGLRSSVAMMARRSVTRLGPPRHFVGVPTTSNVCTASSVTGQVFVARPVAWVNVTAFPSHRRLGLVM